MLKKFTGDVEELDKVQLVTADEALAGALADMLDRTGRFSLEYIRGTIHDAESAGIADAHPALLLVDLDPSDRGDMAALERIMAARGTTLPIIAISDNLSPESAREFMRLRVADWCPRSSVQADLLPACERALIAKAGIGPGAEAKCYAFVPAGGGVGTTTLAIQSAFLIGRNAKNFQSTCLVSLDFQTGSIADYLDLAPNLQLEEIASRPERLDEQLLEVMLSRHDTGLAVLAAENSLRDYGSIDTDLVTRMLDMASAKFDNLVIDMPRVWLPWSQDVLSGCNKVFVVTEMTVPGLRAACRMVDALRDKCSADIDVSVLVNRCRQTLFGGGINSLRKADARNLLGDRLAGFVFEDYRLVREAIDRGVPLFEVDKKNKIDKDLGDVLFPKAVDKKNKKKK